MIKAPVLASYEFQQDSLDYLSLFSKISPEHPEITDRF